MKKVLVLMSAMAILSGNTDLLDKSRLEKKVLALESERKSFQKSKSASVWKLESSTNQIDENKERICLLKADYETFNANALKDKDGNKLNPIKLTGFSATDEKSIGEKLQQIAKNASTHGEYTPIGELYGFPIKVKTEPCLRDGVESKLNRFFIEGNYKYTYNNGQLAMADTKAAATNMLNALERIPKLMEQYENQNEVLMRDIPTLQEIVKSEWKKESELKELKSEVAALERKIQLELKPKEDKEELNPDKIEDINIPDTNQTQIPKSYGVRM